MKQIAVILSGCGVYDGAEIHEAILALLAIDKSGNGYQCFAPNMNQHHVVNHITGEEMPESRNVLTEAARIARGNIKPLNEYNTDEFDALLIPGGFGVAKNLSSFAFDGTKMNINSEFEKAIINTYKANKAIGALCITPAVIAKILQGAKVTIGSDEETIQAIEAFGSEHVITAHDEVTIDTKYKLVTTPCYMLNATISEIAMGIEKVVKTIVSL